MVYVNFNSSFVLTLKFIASNLDDCFHRNATLFEAGVQAINRHNVQQERISFLVFTKESCIELFIHQIRQLVKPARYSALQERKYVMYSAFVNTLADTR